MTCTATSCSPQASAVRALAACATASQAAAAELASAPAVRMLLAALQGGHAHQGPEGTLVQAADVTAANAALCLAAAAALPSSLPVLHASDAVAPLIGTHAHYDPGKMPMRQLKCSGLAVQCLCNAMACIFACTCTVGLTHRLARWMCLDCGTLSSHNLHAPHIHSEGCFVHTDVGCLLHMQRPHTSARVRCRRTAQLRWHAWPSCPPACSASARCMALRSCAAMSSPDAVNTHLGGLPKARVFEQKSYM